MPLPFVMLLFGLSLSGLVFLAFDILTGSRVQTQNRLHEIQEMSYVEDESDDYRLPFTQRVLIPFYRAFLDGVRRLTPASVMKRYETLIIQAGRQGKTTAIRLIGQQVLLAVLLAGGAYILIPRQSANRALLILVMVAVALILPYFSLTKAASRRLGLINRNLPDMLDLLYVSVEAGLGFDMAMKRTADKMKGPLADEFLFAINEMSKGRSREDALRGMVARTQSADLSTLITSIIQAEQLGSNIANTLRIQSSVMREKRKQRAEEQAAKLSTKMLFPIVFFIFPTILIIIMGPMLMKLIETLSGVF